MLNKITLLILFSGLAGCASTDTTGTVTKLESGNVSRLEQTEYENAKNAIPNEGVVTQIMAADEIFVDGKWQVHLAGVDAPIADEAKRVGNYYGKAGYEDIKRLTLNQKIHLKYDKFAQDYMGRLLAYVYLEDGTYLNEYLIRNGHALVACVPPNTRDCKKFSDLQRAAVASRRGIWGRQKTEDVQSDVEPRPNRYGTVASVMDGDTIRLKDGTVVRYIGIDSPEEEDQLYQAGSLAKAAHVRNSSLVANKEVELEYDVEPRDPRGRDLAYVYVKDNHGNRIFVNEQMVVEGMAWVAVFPPNVARIGELFAAQQRAVAARSGVWKR